MAARVSGRDEHAGSPVYDTMARDFEEMTAQAEDLVATATGLRSLTGPARARVTDRAGWVRANVASFQRLLKPLVEKFEPRLPTGALATLSKGVAGVQVGTILGWMSTRVLGQYDLLLIEDDRPEDQDIVYYVGPNILGLEKRYSFPTEQFRLWLALHEVTHRAQFTGIPWMRPHFLSLVEASVGAVEPDPRKFLEGIRRVAGEIRAGRNPIREAGLLGLVADPEQMAVVRQVQALMSLLEGHGDITMDRAGAERIPSAKRFSQVLRERRSQARGAARLLQQLVGLEAKMRQYALGENFIAVVEKAGGPGLLASAWRGPEWLPTYEEIKEPTAWIDRVSASELPASARMAGPPG